MSECPLCRSNMKFRFSVPCDHRRSKENKSYNMFWCSNCNYGHIWDRPLSSEIAKFYDLDDYYTHQKKDITITRKYSQRNFFIDRLRVNIAWRFDRGKHLEPIDILPYLKNVNPSICEIGCGNGRNLDKFQRQGFKVYGVEPDLKAREASFFVTNSVFNGTAENLPPTIKNQQYNVVLMSHVLEHCLEINKAISNAKSLMNNDSILIVEVPNCQCLGFQEYLGVWPWSDIPRHLNFFTSDSLEKILQQHGLNILAKNYVGFYRQFSNSWLEKEENIWTTFHPNNNISKKPNFKFRAWKLLLGTILASESLKYDSVRIIASK